MQRTETLHKFVEEEWDESFAYETSDIGTLLKCDTRLARYYLMKLVRIGILRQVKYKGQTWYVKAHQAKYFEYFKFIGVRII